MRATAIFLLPLFLPACSDRAGTTGDAALDSTVPDAALLDASLLDAEPLDGALADAPADAPQPPPPSRAAARPLTQWVNPMVATGGQGFSTGSAFPGPQRPFGMVRPGPDTTLPAGAALFAHCAGYSYYDTLINGFSHTRMHGAGIVDYGALALMPTVGMSAAKTHQDGYRSRFSHERETASPGYYAVTLDDTNVRVELTATDRVAFHRYTFPASSDAVVLLDVGHRLPDVSITDGSVSVDPAAHEVSGFVHFSGGYSARFGGVTVHYVARFSRPFARHGVWSAGTLTENAVSSTGPDVGAYAAFDPAAGSVVEARVGISFVDVEHARSNLDAESAGVTFDDARTAAQTAWENALGVAEVEGRTDRDFRVFYTALYHSLLMPTLAMDVDGSYRGMDGAVHQAQGFRYYTDFSLWDTYRTLHPLLTLLYPAWQTDMLRSMIRMGEEDGTIDRWPLGTGATGGMVGDSADIVFADSYVKGLRDWDLRTAYTALRRAAFESPLDPTYFTREGLDEFTRDGYVPIEARSKSASVTLEYAYDDWALARLADALNETADRDALLARSRNWRNLHDPASNFLLGRNADGTFPTNMQPTVGAPYYAEGNAWQYLWFVPHDLEGLATVLGGRDATLQRLESFFQDSARPPINLFWPQRYYWHGNEPDIHAAWIFSSLDEPAGTARWSRWIMSTLYNDTEGGLPGNDDSGTLSAWFVFSALGLFPIAGEDYYLLGSPIFTRATLHLPGGDFTVRADDSSDRAMYIESATLEGAPLTRARVPHSTVADGGSLVLRVVEAASTWGRR